MKNETASTVLALNLSQRRAASTRVPEPWGDWVHRFVRQNGILIALLVFGTLWTWSIYAIALHNARVDIRAELEAEYQARIADYVSEWEKDHSQTVDEFLQAQIEADTLILEHVGMGVLITYDRADLNDAGTQMQTLINRVLSGGEFQRIGSIQDAVSVSGAWTGFDMRASVTEDVHSLALKIATAYHMGKPMPCSSKYLWTEWDYSENELVARDRYKIDSGTHYWRYG